MLVTERDNAHHVEAVSHDEHEINDDGTTADGIKPSKDTSDDTDEKIKIMDIPTKLGKNKTKSGYSYVINIVLGRLLLALMMLIV